MDTKGFDILSYCDCKAEFDSFVHSLGNMPSADAHKAVVSLREDKRNIWKHDFCLLVANKMFLCNSVHDAISYVLNEGVVWWRIDYVPLVIHNLRPVLVAKETDKFVYCEHLDSETKKYAISSPSNGTYFFKQRSEAIAFLMKLNNDALLELEKNRLILYNVQEYCKRLENF